MIIGLKTTPRHMAGGGLLAALTFAVASACTEKVWPAAVAAVVTYLLVAATFRGSTIYDWTQLRRHRKDPLSPSVVASSEGAAVILSPERSEATVWMELTPAKRLQVVTTGDTWTTLPELDLDALSEMMDHGGISLERIEAVTAGLSAVIPHGAPTVTRTVMGDSPTYLGSRSFLLVTLRLDSASQAIRSRSVGTTHAEGTHRTVLQAAARIQIRLGGMGIRARVLSQPQVEAVSKDHLSHVADSLDNPGWSSLGGSDFPAVVMAPQSATAEQTTQWRSLPTRRTFEVQSVERGMRGLSRGYALTLVAERALPSLPKSSGLRPLGGQQVQSLSRIVPVASTMPLALPAASSTPTTWVGGLGLYLGNSEDAEKVSLTLTPFDGGNVYVSGGGITLAQQLVLRIAALSLTVDVRTNTGDEETTRMWRQFVDGLETPLVTFDDNPDPDIAVVLPGGERSIGDDQVALVITDQVPRRGVDASIVAVSGSDNRSTTLTVTSGSEQKEVPWVLTAAEREYIVDA